MFKNLTIYRLTSAGTINPDSIDEALQANAFVPCTPTQALSAGWAPPRGEAGGPLAETSGDSILLKLMIETRSVPGPNVAKRVNELAEEVERQTGRKPGKKQSKELKEQAIQELLPNAFSKHSSVMVWIDRKTSLVAFDTASQAKVDHATTLLVKSVPNIALSWLNTNMTPASAMAHWLGTGEAPYQFSIDRDCELKSTDEMRSVIRYRRKDLGTEEVRDHITSGMMPTKLALTYIDRVSFVLSESGAIRGIDLLDVVFESTGQAPNADAFDADAVIATAELRALIQALVEALGGEQEIERAA